MDCDFLFLTILTGVSLFILAIDFKVLEKMFQEYFKVQSFMEQSLYQQCYKPQAQMRIIFECFAIYGAVLCSSLTLAICLNLSDDQIEWLAKKCINTAFLFYGPLLFLLCVYGLLDIKNLSLVCNVQGPIHGQVNFVNIVILISTFIFSCMMSLIMAFEKTFNIAEIAFSNETSLLYRITTIYFQYTQRIRRARSRDRRQDREFRREQEEADRETEETIQSLLQSQEKENKQESKNNISNQRLRPVNQPRANDGLDTEAQSTNENLQSLGHANNSPRPIPRQLNTQRTSQRNSNLSNNQDQNRRANALSSLISQNSQGNRPSYLRPTTI